MTFHSPIQGSQTIQASTESWPDEGRLELWRALMSEHVVRVDVEPISHLPFSGEVVIRKLPRLTAITGYEAGIRYVRRRELLDDRNDDFVLIVSGNGHTIVSQRNQELALGEQEATLWSAAEPGWICRPAFDKFLALRIPRRALAQLVRNPDRKVMRRIPRNCAPLQLLTRYVGIVRDNNATEPESESGLIARHILELVAAAIKADDKSGVSQGVRAARLEAIRSDILANLSQVRLSPKIIARRHGVTARYVHLLFEQTGQTFSKFVEEARLQRAISLLSDPLFRYMKIGEIASQVGYAEHSTFHRAFRRYFGETPGRVRRTAYLQVEGRPGTAGPVWPELAQNALERIIADQSAALLGEGGQRRADTESNLSG